MWIFSSSSHSFGYGYEAVRIRVKLYGLKWILFVVENMII
jgi:hypothetical protein